METINISDNYATVFINHQNTLSQKAEAYVQAQHKFVNVVDVIQHRLTSLQLLEIVGKCNVPINELFDRTSLFYQEKMKHTSNFSDTDLAHVLVENPSLIRTPFVVKGNKLKFFESAADLT